MRQAKVKSRITNITIKMNLYFCDMEAILIHPEDADQLKTVKAVLKALKVPFEPQSKSLPPHVLASAEKSIRQSENGFNITLREFKNKHLLKK